MKSIGILGGMGPEATAELYMTIIRVLQKKGAVYDKDFPSIYIYSLPAPDIVEQEEDISNLLAEGLRKLQKMGADVLAIPCNTAECILNKNTDVPKFISVVRETVNKITECNYSRVGLLSTKTTIRSGLYQDLLGKRGVSPILPNKIEEDDITRVILNIMSGKKLSSDKKILEKIAARMTEDGAEVIVLGCTELPLIFKNTNYRVMDTIQILCESILKVVNGCDSTMASVSVCGTEEAGSNPARGPKRGEKDGL